MKLLCIDDAFYEPEEASRNCFYGKWIKEGEIYNGTIYDGDGVELEEVPGRKTPFGPEYYCFKGNRFVQVPEFTSVVALQTADA